MLAFCSHDFHASLADCSYQQREKSIECTLRIFSDDLESGVSLLTGKKFVLDRSDSITVALHAYLNDNFGFALNGKSLAIHWIGKELEQDVCYVYGECKLSEPLKGVFSIRYSLLTELFNDQRNLLNIKIQDDKSTLLFDKGTPTTTISIP